MPLFEVAILEKATKKEQENGSGTEKLVFGPKCLVAKDSQTAALMAMQTEGAKIDLHRAEVMVRPFS